MGTATTVFIPLPLLVSSLALLLPLGPILKLDGRIPTAVLANEGNSIGEVGLEFSIEGIGDALQRLFLLGVVSVSPQQAFVDGNQKLTIVRRDYLDLVGQLRVSPGLRGDLSPHWQSQLALALHPLAFPGGPREESWFLVSQGSLDEGRI